MLHAATSGHGNLRIRGLVCAVVLPFGLVIFNPAIGSGADTEGNFFETKIRPMFAEHCYKCHSGQDGKVKGGLRLDTVAGIRAGGDSGPLFVSGKPKESLLVTALRHEETAMPPAGKLPDEIVNTVVGWIERGASLPVEAAAGPMPRREAFRITDADRDHWSFRPVTKPAIPVTPGETTIDRLLHARLQAAGLPPAELADKYTLLRRVTYDLTGLPPTLEQIDAFLADDSADAFPRVVDRLLSSPEFGVHWGRHWLDGVRYASDVDKSGRYREWVIRSINEDLPYDRFLTMQLAGDLIPADTDDPTKLHVSGASIDGVSATGMLALAVWELVGRDLAVAEIVDSQIDVVGRQLLGLTLACARCHDHKFDPISAEDYYGLAGILFSSKISPGKLIADGRLSGEVLTTPLLSKVDDAHNRKLDSRIRKLTAELHSLPNGERLDKLFAAVAKLEADHAAAKAGTAKTKAEQALQAKQKELEDAIAEAKKADAAGFSKVQQLRDQIAQVEKEKIVPVTTVVTQEGGVPGSNREAIADAPVLIRGDFRREGKVVPRRFPVILAGEDQPRITNGSGRLELARWITQPDNPLTSRVMVNRIWQNLFGDALVRTPDNFGRLGEAPTHPELLDYLATQFVSGGWSVKKLVREIVLTRAYQQSSFASRELLKADPDNRLVGRMTRKRLTYESLRDTLLVVSDQLADQETQTSGSVPRRTMYEPVERRKPNEMRTVFDGPDPKEVVTGRADTTTTPQALFLLNNKLVLSTAERISRDLAARTDLASDETRIDFVYRRLIGRPPTPRESELAAGFLASGTWGEFLQVLLCTNEFIYVE